MAVNQLTNNREISMNIIRNGKNTGMVNLDRVTQIYPSINEETKAFNLYFIFDAINMEECNEVKWELGSRDEIERILCALDIREV